MFPHAAKVATLSKTTPAGEKLSSPNFQNALLLALKKYLS
jgi:hypothetical protein